MSETVEQPPAAPEAPPEAPPAAPEPVAAAAPADDDAAAVAALEAGAIEVPEGDGIVKLVPLSAATKARDEAKQYRKEAKDAAEKLAQFEQQWREAQPYVDAARAVLANPQPAAPPADPQGPTPEQRGELEEVAKLLDFYKTDGSLDLERATKHLALIDRAAERKAAAQMAPLQQDAQVAKAQGVLNQARAWTDPVTKETADPKILANLWNRVSKQPGGLETLSNPEAAMFIWGQALNLTRWQKGQGGAPAAAAAPQPPPGPAVLVEASGGATGPVTLSAMEKRAAKDLGMSESEYLKAAAKAPRGM